jgi:Domain of unknown function (DUF1905)
MAITSASSPGPLDHTFTATLTQSPVKGGWTYVVMDGSADFFASRGLVKASGTIDDQAFTSSFMALGDGPTSFRSTQRSAAASATTPATPSQCISTND